MSRERYRVEMDDGRVIEGTISVRDSIDVVIPPGGLTVEVALLRLYNALKREHDGMIPETLDGFWTWFDDEVRTYSISAPEPLDPTQPAAAAGSP